MALLLVFTASAAALALEALLARYFALTQWHHLSFMVISVALLGFSASGTWLNLAATRAARGARERRGSWETRPARAGGGGARGKAPPEVVAARRLRGAAGGMAVSSVAMFLVLRLLPLDFFRIPSEPLQLLYLAVSYLACAVPFFFAGLVTAVAFAGAERPGAVYAAAMSGSAAGVLLPIILLPAAGLRAALMAPAALLLTALLIAGVGPPARRDGQGGHAGRGMIPPTLTRGRPARRDGQGRGAVRAWLPLAAAVAAVGLGGGLVLGLPALEPRPGPYKYLAHLLRFPDTRLEARRDTVRGRIDEVTGPTIRFAPGLSLGAGAPVPPQRALVRDGDAALFLMEEAAGDGAAGAWLEALHPALALHLGSAPPRSVLVLQEGGGVLLAAALRAAGEVRVAVPSAAVARRLRELPVGAGAGLQVVEDEPRALARRLVRAGARFDAVLIEDWGASLAGTESHAQEPLLTVEAFRDYLALLAPDGVLSVARRLLLPPANAPRLVAVAAQALTASGRESPAEHVAVVRNWDSFTLLVTPQPLAVHQLRAVRAFAERHGFDLVALPGLRAGETNRFSRLAEPFHAQAAAAVLDPARAAALGGGLVDVRPPTDDRPFFNRFVRWAQLSAYQRATGGRLYGLLLSGDVVALAVLAEALLLALVLLAIPWLRAARLRGVQRRPPPDPRPPTGSRAAAAGSAAGTHATPPGRSPTSSSAPTRRRAAAAGSAATGSAAATAGSSAAAAAGNGAAGAVVAYNLAVGLGFILLELMLIQRLTVALGDPVVSFKVVLGALLIWSAAGGLLSERVAPPRTWLALAVVTGTVLAYAVAASPLLPWLLGLPRVPRVAAIVVALAPLGAALGMAFPLGLRLLAPAPATRALAWAANGCASVIGAVASTLIAVAQGITALGLIAAAGYALATLVAAQQAARRAP